MPKRDAAIARCEDGRTGAARRAAAGALVAAACALAVACARPAPRQIALGDDIDIGPYVIEVLRARNAPLPPPPISTFRTEPGKKCIVVFVDWKKLGNEMSVLGGLAFIEKFLEYQLSIADANGKRTEALSAMQAKLMYMQDPGPNLRDWVVLFHVPDESHDFTLLVENPEPADGQAHVTAVPLGI